MSYLAKDNDYDASFDVGVAVKEESPEAALNPKTEREKLGRSGNGMQRVRSGSTASTDAEEGNSSNGGFINNAAINDEYTPATAIGRTARSEKKSKKKRKREKSTNFEADPDHSISNERSSKSSIHTKLTTEIERRQKKSVFTLLPLKGMFVDERKKLPIYQHSAEIVDLISNNSVVLVVAETVSQNSSVNGHLEHFVVVFIHRSCQLIC